MPGSGSSMVGDNKNKNQVELQASLAPAVAEVWAVAKADQNNLKLRFYQFNKPEKIFIFTAELGEMFHFTYKCQYIVQ